MRGLRLSRRAEGQPEFPDVFPVGNGEAVGRKMKFFGQVEGELFWALRGDDRLILREDSALKRAEFSVLRGLAVIEKNREPSGAGVFRDRCDGKKKRETTALVHSFSEIDDKGR